MVNTAANFRAIRELCGITQQVAADALGINVLSVKRWEYGSRRVSEAAMEWLLERAAEHDAGVDDLVSSASSSVGVGDEVRMSYYLSQEQADIAAHPDEAGDYQFLNAITREASARLKALGYRVSFTYPNKA